VGALRTANLGLSFLLELAMLGAVVYWGFAAHRSLTVRLLAGVGLPILLITFWALFMAPRSPRRIPWPWEPGVALLLFLLAAGLLLLAGRPVLAVVLAALAVLNAVAVYAFGQQ